MTSKRVKTGSREIDIEVPRDRASTFERQLVRKGQQRLPDFDDKVSAPILVAPSCRRDADGILAALEGVIGHCFRLACVGGFIGPRA